VLETRYLKKHSGLTYVHRDLPASLADNIDAMQRAHKGQLAFMGGILKRMMFRHLSMAWEKWQQDAAAYANQMFILKGAVNRMLKRKLSMAWEQWQFVYEDAKRQAFMLSGAIRRLQNRKLSMAWEQWYMFTIDRPARAPD